MKDKNSIVNWDLHQKINSADKPNLDEFLDSVNHLAFFTSGQIWVWDKENNQIGALQLPFMNGESNPKLLKQIAERANRFNIAKWPDWSQELSKEEFFKITNLNSF